MNKLDTIFDFLILSENLGAWRVTYRIIRTDVISRGLFEVIECGQDFARFFNAVFRFAGNQERSSNSVTKVIFLGGVSQTELVIVHCSSGVDTMGPTR